MRLAMRLAMAQRSVRSATSQKQGMDYGVGG